MNTHARAIRRGLFVACGIFSAAIHAASGAPLPSHLSQQQELTAPDAVNNDQLGTSVAISSDGNTALVGAFAKSNHAGAAYIFARSDAGWTLQQELTDPGPGFDAFGWSVALSSDGNTALVSAYTNANLKGTAYIYVRSGNGWSQQQQLTAGDGVLFDQFGYSVALSADGNTALIGAPVKANARGAAYVFTRSGTTWNQQQKLSPSDLATSDKFGLAAALSGDGNSALIGAPNKNSAQGLVYAFTRSGEIWNQQQEFTSSDGAPGDQFGTWITASGDGSTALFGILNKAYVFTSSGSTWTQQQELTPPDGFFGYFGSTVALSNNGNIGLLGAYESNNRQGAAYVFTRDSFVWSQQQVLTALDAADDDQLGWSVALAGDGKTALLGADLRNNGQGAAYVFATDSIAPTAAPAQSPLPNSSGWNTTDVLITWNWTDNPGGSGVDPANCTNSTASTGEGTFQITAACNDLAGNVGNASYTAKVDKTGPTVTGSGKKADNTAYIAGAWTNQNVTVIFSCSDSASGVATCPGSQTFSASTGTVSGTAFDVAGNSSVGSFGPIQIERVPPTISATVTGAPNANGWYNANVTVRFTCQDADSGIPAGGCPADQILNTEGASVSSAAMTVTDVAGNVSALSNVVTVAIDKTNPSVTYTGNLGTYGVDQTVSITCTATDALSGIASTTCANVNGDAYAIGVGSHTSSATASDRAGNTGQGSATYKIVVTFSGVANLVNRWVTKTGIASNLTLSLQGAQAAFASGSVTSGDNQLKSFINQVSSQSGKSLTTAQANLLIQYAQALMR